MKLSKLPILKLTATGNDFLLVDLRKAAVAKTWKSEWAKRPRAHWVKLWCHRQEGLGADGMVFLEKDKDADFKWDFYNSDGSSAEMCGNAARAVSLYASDGGKNKKLNFNTRVGIVEATVKSAATIEVRLPKIAEGKWNQVVSWKGTQMYYDFVRAGVPHVVVRVPNLDERSSLRDFALEIKRQPSFLKEGTNVTFVRLVSNAKVESVTFERGVEDFTLSCGTGAVASAHSVLRGEENSEVEVQVPGGTLSVVWRDGYPYLKGPARIVAEMHLSK
jgi:diaminopimelate epimerase